MQSVRLNMPQNVTSSRYITYGKLIQSLSTHMYRTLGYLINNQREKDASITFPGYTKQKLLNMQPKFKLCRN